MAHCQHGYTHQLNSTLTNNLKKEESSLICVNPYHYIRGTEMTTSQLTNTPSLLTVYVPKANTRSEL